MAQLVSDYVLARLRDWGVEHVFGFPGDGINGVFESLRERQDKIRFVQVRHEEAGAFAACAYAKFTGKLGVCLATSGPGGVHLLNGIYDAKLDGQPVLAITGAQHHDLLSTLTQQDIELSDRLMAEKRMGLARLKCAYAWQSMLKTGAKLAFGTDFPVESPNPFPGLAAAMAFLDRRLADLGRLQRRKPARRKAADQAAA